MHSDIPIAEATQLLNQALGFSNEAMLNVKGKNGKVYSYPKSRYADSTRNDARRNEDGLKKGWQITEMWDSHHEIARLLVMGHTNVDIAERLGCTPTTISNVRNSPVVKDKLTIMQAARDAGTIDLSIEIMNLAPIALQKIREALETGMVMGKEVPVTSLLKEANNLLDRHIGKAIQRVDSRSTNAHFSLEDIERIKERARTLAPNSEEASL